MVMEKMQSRIFKKERKLFTAGTLYKARPSVKPEGRTKILSDLPGPKKFTYCA